MRKENPKCRRHVTLRDKVAIRRLTLKKVRQSVISRTLGIYAPAVSRVQIELGLPTRVPTPERKIMLLFRRGWSGYKISKFLHCPANRVWATMHKYGFTRKDKLGVPTPPENIARFEEAVRRREGYIGHLAIKYQVGKCKANRLAHEILGTYRFRPGASKPPLSSTFPQKHYDGENRT